MSRSSLNINPHPSRRGPAPSALSLSASQPGSSGHASGSSTTFLAPNPHQKPSISVEEWERKAPLSELQTNSVTAFAKANEIVPLPLKFSEDPNGKEPPGTPRTAVNKHLLKDGAGISRPGTPGSPSTPRPTTTHPLHPQHPVQTPQQFYDWFALVDRSVAHSQEAHYRAHVASLDEHLAACDLLLRRIGEVEKEVDGMLEGWRGVEEGGKSLQGACERLLEERDSLISLMDDISSHLEYFQELEHATRMLNHPGESLIFQADFHYMVERVDICINFLREHRHYREAEVYLLRFQQCMTRAMTLIRMNFVGSLRALSAEISKRVTDKEVSSTAQQHLLYTRFISVASKVSPLLGELETRAQSYPDELNALLSECHSAYFSTRRALLVPRIMEEIRGLDPGRTELVELTRSGCSYLKQLCTDEFNLYREFFSTAEDQLYQYLETLCDLLYDDLRPRILHEPRLTVLCEVCTVLQALMVLDATTTPSISSTASSTVASSDEEDSSDEDEDPAEDATKNSKARNSRTRRSSQSSDQLTVNFSDPSGKRGSDAGRVGKRLHTGHLLKMVLQDAQTKLFFKAQAVVQSDIRHYVPTPEELKWPDVLVAANSLNNPTASAAFLQEKQSTSQIFHSISSLDRQHTWFPTLRKTVWVLSQLRDFVKPAIFEDIAQEALGVCRASLVNASEIIKGSSASTNPSGTPGSGAGSTAGPTKVLDGVLFLTRHLLILKEVLASLEVDLQAREGEGEDPDLGLGLGSAGLSRGAGSGLKSPVTSRALEFAGLAGSSSTSGAIVGGGGMTETLSNMISKTTSLLPEGLFASLGVARGAESDMRGVKMDIDQNLRKACEDVIATCAQPLTDPLEAWVYRVNVLKGGPAAVPAGGGGLKSSIPQSATGAPNATGTSGPQAPANMDNLLSSAPQTQLQFHEALQRDLRSSVARVRLYLEDERTVKVLLEHVVDRILGSYERFGNAVSMIKRAGFGGVDVEIMSSAALRAALREVTGGSYVS